MINTKQFLKGTGKKKSLNTDSMMSFMPKSKKMILPTMFPKGNKVFVDRYPVFPGNKPVKNKHYNLPQKKFLKKHKLNDLALFTDHDKDGVISGADCYPFDPTRHGKLWDWVKEKVGYSKPIEREIEKEHDPDYPTPDEEYDEEEYTPLPGHRVLGAEEKEYDETAKPFIKAVKQRDEIKSEYDEESEKLSDIKKEISELAEKKERDKQSFDQEVQNIISEEEKTKEKLSKYEEILKQRQTDLEKIKSPEIQKKIEDIKSRKKELSRDKSNLQGKIIRLEREKEKSIHPERYNEIETELSRLKEQKENITQLYQKERGKELAYSGEFIKQDIKAKRDLIDDKTTRLSELSKKKEFLPKEHDISMKYITDSSLIRQAQQQKQEEKLKPILEKKQKTEQLVKTTWQGGEYEGVKYKPLKSYADQSFTERIGTAIKDKKDEIYKEARMKVGKHTGYAFEPKARREEYAKEQLSRDIKDKERQFFRAASHLEGDAFTLAKRKMDFLLKTVGPEARKKRDDSIKEKGSKKESLSYRGLQIDPQDHKFYLDSLKSLTKATEEKADIDIKSRKLAMAEKQAGLEYAKVKMIQSRENLMTLPLKGASERASARMTTLIAERQMRPPSMSLSGIIKPVRSSQPIEMQRETSLGGFMVTRPQRSVSDFADQENYDSTAPKYVYKRDPLSFTRKSSRRAPGEAREELPGTRSDALITPRSGSSYPWTKPMVGWQREVSGYGRTTKRGRRKGTKLKSSFPVQKKKQKFVPFQSTYHLKGKKHKGSYLDFL